MRYISAQSAPSVLAPCYGWVDFDTARASLE